MRTIKSLPFKKSTKHSGGCVLRMFKNSKGKVQLRKVEYYCSSKKFDNFLSDIKMIFQNSSPWVSHVFYTDTFPFLPLFHFFFSFFYSTFFIFLVSEPFIWFFFEKRYCYSKQQKQENTKRERNIIILPYIAFFLSYLLYCN